MLFKMRALRMVLLVGTISFITSFCFDSVELIKIGLEEIT